MAAAGYILYCKMPPTRGHDLKRQSPLEQSNRQQDAPHTGARLETDHNNTGRQICGMPPTRGHDLKLRLLSPCCKALQMPPTRGHDLKHEVGYGRTETASGCPPHGGTT